MSTKLDQAQSVSRVLKDYRETGALKWGFVDDTTFLTQASAVGVVYRLTADSGEAVPIDPIHPANADMIRRTKKTVAVHIRVPHGAESSGSYCFAHSRSTSLDARPITWRRQPHSSAPYVHCAIMASAFDFRDFGSKRR
jgi:hypothetical protein